MGAHLTALADGDEDGTKKATIEKKINEMSASQKAIAAASVIFPWPRDAFVEGNTTEAQQELSKRCLSDILGRYPST